MIVIYKHTATLLFAWFFMIWEHFTSVGSSNPVNHSFNPDAILKKVFQRQTKIVGGYTCSILDYPYLVSLQYGLYTFEHLCGGSLLTEFWVLTAKHCVEHYCDTPHSLTVVAGAEIALNYGSNPPKNTKIQRSIVKKCYMHRRSSSIADISLLKLLTPMKKARNIGFAKLPFGSNYSGGSTESACNASVVVGWGDQFIKDKFDRPVHVHQVSYKPNLQCAELKLITMRDCRRRLHGRRIRPSFFCAYTLARDTCQGDSGGPFICNGYVHGIISSGEGCAYQLNPGFYTKVQFFEKFIRFTMSGKNYRCDNCGKPSASSKKETFNQILILTVVLYTINSNYA